MRMYSIPPLEQEQQEQKNISTTHPGTNKPTAAANSKTVVHALTQIPVKDDLSTTYP